MDSKRVEMMATFHSCVSRAEFDCERTRAEYAEAKYDALVVQIDRLRAALEQVPCSCDHRENPEWEHDKSCAVAIADRVLNSRSP